MFYKEQEFGPVGTLRFRIDRDRSTVVPIDVELNNEHKARATDLELLGHLKAFSGLSDPDKIQLLSALETANFTKHDVIVRESDLPSNAHILLAETASITCLNVRTERVMVALLLGVLPNFPPFISRDRGWFRPPGAVVCPVL